MINDENGPSAPDPGRNQPDPTQIRASTSRPGTDSNPDMARENIEGQTDSTPVEKYHFT